GAVGAAAPAAGVWERMECDRPAGPAAWLESGADVRSYARDRRPSMQLRRAGPHDDLVYRRHTRESFPARALRAAVALCVGAGLPGCCSTVGRWRSAGRPRQGRRTMKRSMKTFRWILGLSVAVLLIVAACLVEQSASQRPQATMWQLAPISF